MTYYIHLVLLIFHVYLVCPLRGSLAAEPSLPTATFVTALFDIGRGDWVKWKRSFQTYLEHIENIFKLTVSIVVYCENSTADYLKSTYKRYIHPNVHIFIKLFRDIEFYNYRQIIKNIMWSKEFKRNNRMLNHPEGFSVDYVILMNNKLSFMKDAVRLNKFNSTHFFWIDAGYGHGNKSIFPDERVKWSPSTLLNLDKTVTFISLMDPDVYKKYGYKLHKEDVGPAISGGFFGGHKSAVKELYHIYKKIFHRLLLENIVDDDQNVVLQSYYELPRLFNLVPGDWFDAFNLFGK